jgi:hypothetical protein
MHNFPSLFAFCAFATMLGVMRELQPRQHNNTAFPSHEHSEDAGEVLLADLHRGLGGVFVRLEVQSAQRLGTGSLRRAL